VVGFTTASRCQNWHLSLWPESAERFVQPVHKAGCDIFIFQPAFYWSGAIVN
jgi:hypothetical protein